MGCNTLKRMKVSEVMTNHPICVKPGQVLTEVEEIFDRENFHHLPVIDDNNQLVGIISRKDMQLMKDWSTQIDHPDAKYKNAIILGSTLVEYFAKDHVVSVQADDTLEQCAIIFKDNTFHALPVVEDGQLIGIVTTYDLISAAFDTRPCRKIKETFAA